MEFGVCLPNYGETSSPEGIVRFAQEAEALGYSSVWTTDHLLMRQDSGTPYERTFESIATLTYVAALTRRVRLGVSSLVMGLRDPALVAKQLATLDQLSGGRLVLATGAGWYEPEFQNLGADFHRRGKRLDEALQLIFRLWYGEGPVDFDGRILPHRIRQTIFDPKPAQRHVELYIAGNSLAAMKRSVRYADGWHPNLYPLQLFEGLVKQFRSIEGAQNKKILVRVAIDPSRSDVEYTGPQGEKRAMLSGDPEKNRALVRRLESLGVSGMVLAPNYSGKVSVEDQLRAIRLFAQQFMG